MPGPSSTPAAGPGSVPGWRLRLQDALDRHASAPLSLMVQLATVRQDGRPAARTVVFRGFDDTVNGLLFTTDLRSAKAKQLAGHPWAEACWLFAEPREQFRLLGPARVVGPDDPQPADPLQHARRRDWQGLAEALRQSFTWPTPGADRAEPEAFASAPPSAAEPPATFALILLEPVEVDHLVLHPASHDRHLHRRAADGRWLTRPINP